MVRWRLCTGGAAVVEGQTTSRAEAATVRGREWSDVQCADAAQGAGCRLGPPLYACGHAGGRQLKRWQVACAWGRPQSGARGGTPIRAAFRGDKGWHHSQRAAAPGVLVLAKALSVLAVVECGRPFGARPVAGAGSRPTRIMRFREAAAALRHIFWTCKVASECRARSCVG